MILVNSKLTEYLLKMIRLKQIYQVRKRKFVDFLTIFKLVFYSTIFKQLSNCKLLKC